MTYWGELREKRRPLAAASIGAGASLPLFAYTNSAFAPHLVREFGWSRAQFALIGLTMLSTLLVLPFIGKFTDRLGVRKVAMLGTVLVPLGFVGYACQQGPFWQFVVVSTAMLAIGSLTSPLVYSRLIAENFVQAQGLALTIMNCVPAALAIVLIPVLNITIIEIGWRESYLLLGALAGVSGLIALALIPRDRPAKGQADASTPDPRARQSFRPILTSGLFWIIITAMFLCLIQTPLHSSQMNLMLTEQTGSMQAAANIVSVYAFGTIVGRIACGLALDRFATPLVTALSMVLPAAGFALLGSRFDSLPAITLAMFLVGLAVGAESDLIPYLVARYFRLDVFNSTLSLFHCCAFLASAAGALLISQALARFNNFAPFLFLVAGTVALGSLLFLRMPWSRQAEKIG